MCVAPGMWASSNCSAVRVSTRNAPSATRRSSCPGVIGWASTPSVSSSPRLIATMLAKFGGCAPILASDCSTNSSSLSTPSSSLLASS